MKSWNSLKGIFKIGIGVALGGYILFFFGNLINQQFPSYEPVPTETPLITNVPKTNTPTETRSPEEIRYDEKFGRVEEEGDIEKYFYLEDKIGEKYATRLWKPTWGNTLKRYPYTKDFVDNNMFFYEDTELLIIDYLDNEEGRGNVVEAIGILKEKDFNNYDELVAYVDMIWIMDNSSGVMGSRAKDGIGHITIPERDALLKGDDPKLTCFLGTHEKNQVMAQKGILNLTWEKDKEDIRECYAKLTGE